MNATIGTLLLLINLFLPGLLFLRFYYSGEFSKQFNTSIPLIQLGFRSFIPGLIIQTLGLWVVNMIDKGFSLEKANQVYAELLGSPLKYSTETSFFLKDQIGYFILYTILTCISGLLTGMFFLRLVRYMAWDIKYKILRFKNHWSYIFSGQYLLFDRYKKVRSEITFGQTHPHANEKIMMTVIDVLIAEGELISKYSGTVVDYDLDANDNNNLERIYLTNVYKYKLESDDDPKETQKKNRLERKEIPGDLFLLETKNMMNMNITYVPSIYYRIKKERDQDTVKVKRQRAWRKFKSILSPITLLFLIFLAVVFFTGLKNLPIITFIYKEFNFFQKLWLIITLLVTSALFFYDEKKKEEDPEEYRSSLQGMWFFIATTCFFILWELFIYKLFY